MPLWPKSGSIGKAMTSDILSIKPSCIAFDPSNVGKAFFYFPRESMSRRWVAHAGVAAFSSPSVKHI